MTSVTSTSTSTTEKLVSDVQQALSGAESMLEQAAGATAEKAAELRGRAMQQLRAMRETLQDAQGKALERTKAAAKATDDYVHDHPWQVVVGATAVGVVLGMLIARNR
jgi:ElaB/YqjD/DUF883 family membrane-anchored ribosome-binding protein